jgi:Protein of unknown function (DUF1161)
MKSLVFLIAAITLAAPVVMAAETCEEMRIRIKEQLQSHHVAKAEVFVVGAEQANTETEGKVMGSCDHGQKKVVVKR